MWKFPFLGCEIQHRNYPAQNQDYCDSDEYLTTGHGRVTQPYQSEIRPSQTPSGNDRPNYTDSMVSCTVYENVSDGWSRTGTHSNGGIPNGYPNGSLVHT